MDRYDLYERCVQQPATLVPFLERLHGGQPRVLAEDFCGTAAVSREWARRSPERLAVGLDLDPAVLDEARARAGALPNLILGREDLSTGPSSGPGEAHAADVLFVGNFSIGELHDRGVLVAYLRRARQRLAPGGVFVCDTYGGPAAFKRGFAGRLVHGQGGLVVHYSWEQREADPLTGRVTCLLHFRAERSGELVADLPEAFVYRWRLWSVPELRDALREAGFADQQVHWDLTGHDTPLPENFIVAVAARAGT